MRIILAIDNAESFWYAMINIQRHSVLDWTKICYIPRSIAGTTCISS